MAEPQRHLHFDHTLPFWANPNATFFVTTCAQQRGLNHFCKAAVGDDMLAAMRNYHDDHRWFCSIVVLMPDHVHFLVSMSPDHDLARTVGMWKRWAWKTNGIEWQPNFFEHRLRRDEGVAQKGQYIFDNPARAGLIARVEDWPWTWRPAVE